MFSMKVNTYNTGTKGRNSEIVLLFEDGLRQNNLKEFKKF